MNGPISPSKDGWLVGAASDGENVVLGADGIPYLKIAPGGTITRMNGARIVGPIKAVASGTGISIGDNVAGVVASVTLPANTMRQIGDRVRIIALLSGDDGGTLIAEMTVNGVTMIDPNIAALTDVVTIIVDMYYIDATHAHFTAKGSGFDVTGGINASGFNFAADQTVAITQTQVADNRVLVYALSVDVFQGAQ